MSLNFSPSVTINDLLFYFDSKNKKSYIGPPISNLATSITSLSGPSFISGTEIVNIPTVGKTEVKFCNIRNDYPASGDCCPAPFNYFSGGTVSVNGSTLYTYSILYKIESGYTHPNYLYRYEFGPSGYITETGIHNDSNRVNLGDGWYWAWGSFTTQSATTYVNIYSFYYRYSTSFDKLSVAKILLTQGNYTELHPKYWPNVSTSRSTTQVLLDLVGKKTIDIVGSPTYNSASITIPNTNSSYINVLSPSDFRMSNQNFTLSCWIKQLDNGANVLLEARGDSLKGYLWVLNYPSSGYISVFLNYGGDQYVYTSSNNTLNTSVIQNIVSVVNRSNNNILIYINGSLWDTISNIHNESISPSSSDLYRIGYDLGGSTQNFEIFSFSHYAKSLTEKEVLQNFNAQRGLYGI